MGRLDDISLGEISIKKRIPIVDEDTLLINALKLMVKFQSRLILVTMNEDVKAITTISLSEYITKNIWELPVIFEEVRVGELKELSTPLVFNEDSNVTQVIEKMFENNALVMEKDETYYEITPEEIFMLYVLWEDEAYQKTIREIASDEIVKVPPTKSIVSTYKRMKDKNVDSAVVVNTANQPIGIVTLSDYVYAYKELLKEINSLKIEREERLSIDILMSNPVIFEFENTNVPYALNKMIENNISHLPIVNEIEQLIGMIYKKNILSLLVEFNESY